MARKRGNKKSQTKQSKQETTKNPAAVDNNDKPVTPKQGLNPQASKQASKNYKPMTADDLLQGTTIGSLLQPICDNMTMTLGLLIIFMFIFLLTLLFITERDYARNGHWSDEGGP